MTTDTPRTDARENSILITCDDSCCAIYIEIDGNEHHGGIVDSDFARQLERELAASKAEVNRLKKRPFGCKCENFREKVLGDGCDECNKALVIKMLTDERDELEAEVERLRNGMQGSCYCCEPVGEMNQKLEAEVERMKNDFNQLKTLMHQTIWIVDDIIKTHTNGCEDCLNKQAAMIALFKDIAIEPQWPIAPTDK
jgi:hypothetical protein